MVTFSTNAHWLNNQLILNYTEGEADEQRRIRAKEIVETYPHTIEDQEGTKTITFYSNLIVSLNSLGVRCSCPDFSFRRSPCKHIFAGAYLCGDKSAIKIVDKELKNEQKSMGLEITVKEINEPTADNLTPAKPRKNTNPPRSGTRGSRPQDIRIGKYFVLSDFLYSSSQAIYGIPNCPDNLNGREVYCLQQLTKEILDPVVEQFGQTSITYGFAGKELYQKIYGGKGTGVHGCIPPKEKGARYASAADILVHSQIENPRTVLNWIRDNCVYDRLILYQNSPIICVAWADKPRFHCKEWFIPDSLSKAIYIDAIREGRPTDGLADGLKNYLIEVEPDLASDLSQISLPFDF